MKCAMNGLTKRQHNESPQCATALNVNTDAANARGSGGRIERNEITSKRGKLIEHAESTNQN
jgi:hypothetical protein